MRKRRGKCRKSKNSVEEALEFLKFILTETFRERVAFETPCKYTYAYTSLTYNDRLPLCQHIGRHSKFPPLLNPEIIQRKPEEKADHFAGTERETVKSGKKQLCDSQSELLSRATDIAGAACDWPASTTDVRQGARDTREPESVRNSVVSRFHSACRVVCVCEHFFLFTHGQFLSPHIPW